MMSVLVSHSANISFQVKLRAVWCFFFINQLFLLFHDISVIAFHCAEIAMLSQRLMYSFLLMLAQFREVMTAGWLVLGGPVSEQTFHEFLQVLCVDCHVVLLQLL